MTEPKSTPKDEPELDYYPDSWGMEIKSDNEVSPEEARKLIDALEEARKKEPYEQS